jgi:hypothetical protein
MTRESVSSSSSLVDNRMEPPLLSDQVRMTISIKLISGIENIQLAYVAHNLVIITLLRYHFLHFNSNRLIHKSLHTTAVMVTSYFYAIVVPFNLYYRY